MAYPNARIFQCNERGIEAMAYDGAKHAKVTRDFLADPKRMLSHLMNDDRASASLAN